MINFSTKFENSVFETIANRQQQHQQWHQPQQWQQLKIHDYVGSLWLRLNERKGTEVKVFGEISQQF